MRQSALSLLECIIALISMTVQEEVTKNNSVDVCVMRNVSNHSAVQSTILVSLCYIIV